jgi:lycopene cyclase domain-containing protein
MYVPGTAVPDVFADVTPEGIASTGTTMTPETYLGFHLVFVVLPICLVAVLAFRRPRATWGRMPFLGVVVVVCLAVVYTTPWDSLLIERGVWWYGDGVVAAHLWAVPAGEYLFFVLQPILVSLWLFNFDVPTDGDLGLPVWTRVVGLAAGLAVSAIGLGLLVSGPSTLYLGAILAWAGPILAIQWAFGWPQLVRARRAVGPAVAVPTLYLWLIDRYAIANGLWILSETHTVGIAPFGLPIEEAVFFLVTNVFIVQGLVLYLWLLEQWPSVAPAVRSAVSPLFGGVSADPDSDADPDPGPGASPEPAVASTDRDDARDEYDRTAN